MSPKTVLITGCSEGGIGHSLALEWHKRGYKVFATARKLESMKQLDAAGIECVVIDVTDTASLKKAKEIVGTKTGGTLDFLINNAGQGYTMPLLEVDIDQAKNVYDVNVWGVLRTTQVFSSLIIAAQGTIVIIGSIAGIMPYVFGGAYNSSKAAVQSIADTLRVEMYPFNVKVINICTGGVKTNLSPKAIEAYDLVLPRDSVYLPIEPYFKNRQGYSNANSIPSEEYAKRVVSAAVTSKRSGWFWIGYFSSRCWFLNTFLWKTVFDFFMLKTFGLNELKMTVEKRRKEK